MLAACALVPALNAETTVGDVVDGLQRSLGVPVIVVDDGSSDGTHRVADEHGARVLRHDVNRGKGAALRSGLALAAREGFRLALSADADGQHPAASAKSVLEAEGDPQALVLGVRDLVRDGAPRSNRFGNAVSNTFLSLFAGRVLRDTQCGLRRYPVQETLELRARATGYDFEAEVVLRSLAAGLPLIEVPIDVVYPPRDLHASHFRSVRDPAQIVATVARTVAELHIGRWRR